MSREEEISWYHKKVTRERAEQILLEEEGGEDGLFLVRDSNTSSGDFVLSVLFEKQVVHYQIRRHGEDAFFSVDDTKTCHGIESLIEYYQEATNGLVTRLITPLKGEPPPHDSRRNGRTNLLHRATKEGNYIVVSELIKSGYKLEAKNQDGQTAVHLASIMGKDDILRKLIENEAIVNCRDTRGNTPLHYACEHNHSSTVKLLVAGRANIQARNTETGRVPLHEAAANGHIQVISTLLSLNAPVNPRTSNNELPWELADLHGHRDCVDMLRKYRSPQPRTHKELWYHGTLDRNEAQRLIIEHGNRDGCFLVRLSDRNNGCFVLTMLHEQQLFNFVIKKNDEYFFIDDGPYFDTLEHVIDYYSNMSDGLPCILLKPVPPKPKPPLPKFVPNLFSIYKDENMYIPECELMLGKILGEGEFGSVIQGTYKGQAVAIKTLHKEHSETNKSQFLLEASVMTKLNHHCIVRLIGICREPLRMVQELVSLGSMLAYLINFPQNVSPDYELKLWAAQIACGMKYLEEKKFVHRDLAARNILLASRHQAKISDFGLSRALQTDHEYYKAVHGGKWPLRWYAPESFNFGTFSHASDVWSYGVTLWEMFSYGEQPYGEQKGTEVITAIERGERLKQSEKCPDHVYTVMKKCWEYYPKDRPTFTELLELFSTDTEYINIQELVKEINLN